MSQIKEYIKIAIMNIRSNRGRSVLTMLGIILGISSVILIITIGNGVQGGINNSLNSFAGGQLYFYINSENSSSNIAFDDEDFDAIAQLEHVKGVTEEYSMMALAQARKGQFDASIYAGTEDIQSVENTKIKYGRYFSESDYLTANKVCVISENDAIKMFGTDNAVGMEFEVSMYGNSQTLTIVGISKSSEDSLLNMLTGTEKIKVEMPISVLGSSFGFYVEDYSGFYIVTEGNEYAAEVADKAIRVLEARKGIRGENVILYESFSDEMSSINEIIDLVKVFIVFVAAVSLIVGGIGVMNIMLVSVSERTREIGIRKSLGARTASIMMQFLAESAIIALIGGIIGITLGILGAAIVCLALGFAVKIDIGTIILATVFSSGIGIIFGVYPAKRAARLRPIDALRHE